MEKLDIMLGHGSLGKRETKQEYKINRLKTELVWCGVQVNRITGIERQRERE
jgi:hypothetical protein